MQYFADPYSRSTLTNDGHGANVKAHAATSWVDLERDFLGVQVPINGI